MTLDQALIAARRLDAEYLAPYDDAPLRDAHGTSRSHLRWMVQEMHAGMSNNKAMRWLGYIQGVLVAIYGVSLESMKELSREAAGA